MEILNINVDKKEVANRIVELRIQKGMTQKDLSINLGLSESMVSSIERGARRCNYTTLLRLSKMFNVTTNYLLEGEVKKTLVSKASLNLWPKGWTG